MLLQMSQRLRVHNLHYSSLFSVNNDEVDQIFREALTVLKITKYRPPSVKKISESAYFSVFLKSLFVLYLKSDLVKANVD